jgi:hypothetical protein
MVISSIYAMFFDSTQRVDHAQLETEQHRGEPPQANHNKPHPSHTCIHDRSSLVVQATVVRNVNSPTVRSPPLQTSPLILLNILESRYCKSVEVEKTPPSYWKQQVRAMRQVRMISIDNDQADHGPRLRE